MSKAADTKDRHDGHSSHTTTRKRSRFNLFTNDVRSLLYAHGDVADPLPETVRAIEDILTGYIVDVCHEAARVSKTANRQKIKVDDFKFAVRKDGVKLHRIDQLLALQKEITEARKTFDNSEGKNLKTLGDDEEEEEPEEQEGKGKKSENVSSSGLVLPTKRQKKAKREA